MGRAIRSLLVLALAAAPALADEPWQGTPQVVHFEGTIAADEKAADALGFDAMSLGFESGKTTRWFGVVAARTLDGSSFKGQSLVALLDPYTPMLLIAGPPALVEKLRTAPVGSRIAIEGMLSVDTRNYLLSLVDVLEKAPQ